ncbi:MAG TPA: cbb3-type cytochrome c oxidase N-terminal domain-containing protein [Kiritimatiellia bacterium]|nr:cbb3-type cytochrome c oxidase N-terminal domain-containing protein [Kiritimatiellia bacterium]HMP00426.1 cbb3-type cytochrome c oxidase N-terminal domain-containing protein [Kiritimatiellia bacterium]HMP97778.1 cbb3-type cytochrome c oxidase N-terminal domain-containing protein [Kiritimatiellia bacterium]
MSEDKENPMAGHEYDGITELDNNLPQWWVWLFVLTCVWALGYMVYYHVMGGPGQIEEYRREMAAAGKPVVEMAAVAGVAATPPPADAPPGFAYPDEPELDNEKLLALGKDIYIKNCLVCHAPDGGGLIGPNMADDYYIHGPTYADSIRIIIQGVPAKGMIPWQGVLKPEEIHAVASYIWTFRGTEPATPKPPEGERASL